MSESIIYQNFLLFYYYFLFLSYFKAIKYKTMGLKDKVLTEAVYKKYILSDYTFIKRPVIVVGKKIFIGHAADQILGAQAALN